MLAINYPIFSCILLLKISWFQHILLARKSADFSSYYWLENQLISACNLLLKISRFQLILLARKSADFSLYFWYENQLISARILLFSKSCTYYISYHKIMGPKIRQIEGGNVFEAISAKNSWNRNGTNLILILQSKNVQNGMKELS